MGTTLTATNHQAQASHVMEGLVINDQEFVDPADYMPTGYGFQEFGMGLHLVSRASDRYQGDDRPFIESELDVALARGLARYITTVNCAGIGILENLVNHVVGEGTTFNASATGPRCPPGLVDAVQEVIDQFVDINDFSGMMDRELYKRDCRDGESFAGLFPKNGITLLRCIEPDFVTDPGSPPWSDEDLASYRGVTCERETDWKYGIHTDKDDVRNVHGYCVQWEPSAEFEYFSSRYVDHHKVNVDSNVKRGLSDFYAPYKWLRQQERLLMNTGEGAAELSAISYIIQHAAAAQQNVKDMRQGQAETVRTTRTATGQQVQYKHRRSPGTKLDVPKGQEYLPGPMGAERGQSFLQVHSGILRQCAVRWQMTEGMVTGDDSNNNMASGIVAGSRYHKYCKAQQGRTKTRFKRIAWRAVQFAHAAGRFVQFNLTFEQIMRLVQLTCDLPQVEVLDPSTQEEIREKRYQNRVISLETWQHEVGVDPEVQRQGSLAPPGIGGPAGGDLITGGGTGPDTSSGAQVDDLAKTALNGAQVTSLMDLMGKAATGALPDGVVAPIIAAAFPTLTPKQIADIVGPLKGFTPTVDANGQPIAAAADPATPGTTAATSAFGATNRLQWKRNTRAIRDVLDEVAANKYSPKQAEAMLQALGLPEELAQKLLTDAADGSLSPEAKLQLSESYASHVSPGWRLVLEAGNPWENYP